VDTLYTNFLKATDRIQLTNFNKGDKANQSSKFF